MSSSQCHHPIHNADGAMTTHNQDPSFSDMSSPKRQSYMVSNTDVPSPASLASRNASLLRVVEYMTHQHIKMLDFNTDRSSLYLINDCYEKIFMKLKRACSFTERQIGQFFDTNRNRFLDDETDGLQEFVKNSTESQQIYVLGEVYTCHWLNGDISCVSTTSESHMIVKVYDDMYENISKLNHILLDNPVIYSFEECVELLQHNFTQPLMQVEQVDSFIELCEQYLGLKLSDAKCCFNSEKTLELIQALFKYGSLCVQFDTYIVERVSCHGLGVCLKSGDCVLVVGLVNPVSV